MVRGLQTIVAGNLLYRGGRGYISSFYFFSQFININELFTAVVDSVGLSIFTVYGEFERERNMSYTDRIVVLSS